MTYESPNPKVEVSGRLIGLAGKLFEQAVRIPSPLDPLVDQRLQLLFETAMACLLSILRPDAGNRLEALGP